MYDGDVCFLESEKSTEKSRYVWISFFVERAYDDDFYGIGGSIWCRSRFSTLDGRCCGCVGSCFSNASDTGA